MDSINDIEVFIFTDDIANSLDYSDDIGSSDESSLPVTLLQGVILSVCSTTVVMLLICQLFVYIRASIRHRKEHGYDISALPTKYRKHTTYDMTSSDTCDQQSRQSSTTTETQIGNGNCSSKQNNYRKPYRKTKFCRSTEEIEQQQSDSTSDGLCTVFMIDPRGITLLLYLLESANNSMKVTIYSR